jgi:ribosomal protein L40E
MSSGLDSKRRINLEADGELPELIEAEAGELLYCTQCGAINPANARFCRKCGHSLEEQEADVIGLQDLVRAKRKKAQASERPHSPLASVILQVITLLSVAWLGLTALVMDQVSALIPIVLAWFLVEAVRNDSKKGITPERAVVGVLTAAAAALLRTAALFYGQGGAIILLMLGWFLTEAVRS